MSESKPNIIKRIMKDTALRARLIFAFSIIINLAFGVFNAAIGVKYRSVWYWSLAIYFIMLVTQKVSLVVADRMIARKYRDDEALGARTRNWVYLFNGVYIVALDFALAAAIIQMVTTENPAHTGKSVAIATAAFCFYKIITASINIVRTRTSPDTILQIIRNITFIAALVSMLALTSTLICTFGSFEELRALIIVVGAAVEATAIALGVIMIVKGATSLSKSVKNS